MPALKYRLYPSVTERKEGNAVPIYLRFAHERSDARKKQLREKPAEWNKLPLEKLPLPEVKQLLDSYNYNFRQLELGARRRVAEWNYTMDAGDPVGMLLPDVQEMRMHAPLLVLKARAEMAEGRMDDAIHTLETGFSFSQQVGDGPFFINDLVGFACTDQFVDCVLELMQRPNGPNLYWGLAVLPRPFITLRTAGEFEQAMLEMQFPELADLDRPRSAEQWDAALVRMRKLAERDIKSPKPGTASSDPAAKSPDLPAAKKYLAEVVGVAAPKVDAMPPAEVLLRYLSHYYRELRDQAFKGSYLPFPQYWPLSAQADQRLKAAPDTEAARLILAFLPALHKVHLAQARIERELTALQAIEALRMYAAAHGGELPEKLDQVKTAPVPNDPGTGQPFEYQRDGQTATLTSRIPGTKLETTGLCYRVTLRK
jgi:hypothetical protein